MASTWCISALHFYIPQTKLPLVTGLHLGNGGYSGVNTEMGTGLVLIEESHHPSLEKVIGSHEFGSSGL